MTKHILSYGGGINSSALFFYLLEQGKPLDLVIFADTGEELPETYDAVKRMMAICQEKGVEFITCRSEKGNLYDYYFKKKKVMSLVKRDCTSKFKISPIRKTLRAKYGKKEKFITYIGITWDEFSRVRKSDVTYIENKYPFVDDKITRLGNLEILKRNGFLAMKSGCKGCIYNSKIKWIKMIIDNPLEFERHKRLEMNNPKYPNLPVKDWIKKYRVLRRGKDGELKWVLTKSYVTINPAFRLEDLEGQYRAQRSLVEFGEDLEPACAVYGGCFL